MIYIHPDVIEKLPRNCGDCPLAFYDDHYSNFFCGISRFHVDDFRKGKKRHHGCMIFDTDRSAAESKEEKDVADVEEPENNAEEINEELDDIMVDIRMLNDDTIFIDGEEDDDDYDDTAFDSDIDDVPEE